MTLTRRWADAWRLAGIVIRTTIRSRLLIALLLLMAGFLCFELAVVGVPMFGSLSREAVEFQAELNEAVRAQNEAWLDAPSSTERSTPSSSSQQSSRRTAVWLLPSR